MIDDVKQGKALFYYLNILSIVLFLSQVGLAITLSNVPNIFFGHGMKIPLDVIGSLILFIGIQIILLILFSTVIWIATLLIKKIFVLSWQNADRFAFGLWINSIIFLLVANKVFIPQSLFSQVTLGLVPHNLAQILLVLVAAPLTMVLIFACISLVTIISKGSKFVWMSTLIFLGVTIFFVTRYTNEIPAKIMSRDNQQPNVILIGVDSVNPDKVGYYGNENIATPNLDNFLAPAVNFMFSITPHARTFPSWNGILTGKFPKNHGIRFNSVAYNQVNFKDTLATILRHHGYETSFATDETRFGAITQDYGFDHVIGNSPRADNYFLSAINDFILSNLLVNTKLGKFLFPHSYANQAAGLTYDPDVFLGTIERNFQQLSNKPQFIAVHFCLTHGPYAWKDLRAGKEEKDSKLFTLSLQRADQQFGDFVKLLDKYHLLDNAVVVVLSDHGESFGEVGDRLITVTKYIKGKNSRANIFDLLQGTFNEQKDTGNKKRTKEDRLLSGELGQFHGHGTDVLSLVQYRTILAWRFFGKANHQFPQAEHSGMASLIDIKRTILDLLHIKSPKPDDGISLLPYLHGKPFKNTARMLFTETCYTVRAITEVNKIDLKAAFAEAANDFEINSQGLVVMKAAAEKKALIYKERAVYYKNWVLALYPRLRKETKQIEQIAVLVNRSSGDWTDDLTTSFAKYSPAQLMLKRLKEFYGEEINYKL